MTMSTATLFFSVLAVFLLMAPGFVLRRRGWLSAAGTADLARLVPYAIYPCLIFTKVVGNYTLRELAAEWVLPAAVFGLMLFGYAAGLAAEACGVRSVDGNRRKSFLFQCAFNNYLFLPLPLVGMLFGEKAMGRLILSSLGAELAIWTLGMFILSRPARRGAVSGCPASCTAPSGILLEDGVVAGNSQPETHNVERPGHLVWNALRHLVTPTLIALALAIGVVMVRDLAGTAWIPEMCAPVWNSLMQAGTLLGAATVPLAMTVAGSSMAQLRLGELRSPLVWGAGALRLLIVPVAALLILQWLPLAPETRQVLQVVAVMPSAIASITFCKVYGGDEHFTTGTVLLTHLLALATVPLLLALV